MLAAQSSLSLCVISREQAPETVQAFPILRWTEKFCSKDEIFERMYEKSTAAQIYASPN